MNQLSTQPQIDLRLTVHELSARYPDIIPLMQQLGFSDIVKPGMLNTAGRFMTIIKGAQLKKIELAGIVAVFESAGYMVIGLPEKPA
ncbi:MAG: DUF1858 domain-containing protein [Eubacteriales bacterium]|nr:DUF1858 domain-containing protein [Eubacteriales bacterium]MDD4461231.1 DUF1858 domain-containing protein [Eubacteriales bacterium]